MAKSEANNYEEKSVDELLALYKSNQKEIEELESQKEHIKQQLQLEE